MILRVMDQAIINDISYKYLDKLTKLFMLLVIHKIYDKTI